mmetsp:Transcript_72810/g.193494  ORF Transcript_72810/g.193494 Transcript_72810/m.193494 type:complete len:160 (+) Transcript_72810:116-595(+)
MLKEPMLKAPSSAATPARCLPAAAEGCLAVAGCSAVNWALHNPYCGLLFRCACTWPWAGGAAGCNIHHASGPKCPWCNVKQTALKWLAPAITGKFTVALMLLVYAFAWAKHSGHLGRSAAALATFVGWGFLMGLTFYLGTDYPCFLFIEDEQTRCGFKQ